MRYRQLASSHRYLYTLGEEGVSLGGYPGAGRGAHCQAPDNTGLGDCINNFLRLIVIHINDYLHPRSYLLEICRGDRSLEGAIILV